MKLKKMVALFYMLLSWTTFCECQKIDTIYYDKDWKVTNSKKFKYYRIAIQKENIVKVFDYYRSGNIQMSGGFKTIDFKDKTGVFFHYDKKMRISAFDLFESSKYPEIQSELINVKLNVPLKSDSLVLLGSYYKNGNLRSLGYGKGNCARQGRWLFFSENGSLSSQETYQNNYLHGECVLYYANGSLFLIGNYKDDNRDGAWEFYKSSGKLNKTIFYSNGKVIKKIR
jgi:antitoxin component YwqK of YwqJK toxin-antitoxin module